MKRHVLGLVLAFSLFALPAAAANAATVEQWNTPAPQFINPKDYSNLDLVHGKLVTNVVLPAGYSSRGCWPVLYLLHGTADSTSTSASLQWLQINNGALLKMKIPAILVIPGSGDSWWVNDWWHGYRHPAWESWILQDLVPLVGKRLHVCSARSDHSIAGLSMGGYGAVYLASQLPGYFGSAASFSGVLSPENPNFLTIFPAFPTYWGPAGKFYALGHDPLALADNLKHTRVFVSAGNGVPTSGDSSDPVSIFEEIEFDQESLSFTQAARAAGVSTTFKQLVGTHSPSTWLQGLSDMLQWHPFKKTVSEPTHWTFTTVSTTGTAWDYQFAFSKYAPPSQLIRFSLSGGAFEARGAGTVTITQPDGKALTGKIPFNIRHGKLIELKHAPKPKVKGGYESVRPLTFTVDAPASATAPVTVSFRPSQKLPSNQEYSVIVISASAFSTTSSTSSSPPCQSTTLTRVPQPAAGQPVSVTLPPPATATTANTWCAGPTYAVVSTIAPTAPVTAIGTLLAYKMFTIP
jgi:S-formylglutathione hydrolase FrmB